MPKQKFVGTRKQDVLVIDAFLYTTKVFSQAGVLTTGTYVRAVVSNYRESLDNCKNSNFFSFTKKSLWVNYFQKQYSKVPASLRFGEK